MNEHGSIECLSQNAPVLSRHVLHLAVYFP